LYKKQFSVFKNIDTTYLDSASTTQKPSIVLEAVDKFYTQYCANTHRSSSNIANTATIKYENARDKIKDFINAKKREEIIFTKGLTESINFVASSFVKDNFKTVIISSLEHHSNIVPWHMQKRTRGNGLEIVDCNNNLEFDFSHFETILQNNPNSFVSIMHVSNSFGIVHNIKKITTLAHKYQAVVMVDGAQSIPHFSVDMQELGVDFYAISGHKMYSTMGVGVLYANEKHLKNLKPYQGGGGSITNVSYDKTQFAQSPICYESGTPNTGGVIALGAAVDFIKKIGYENIAKVEKEVCVYFLEKLKTIENVQTYTDNTKTTGSISFNIKNISSYDIGMLLDSQNIAIRYGNHCTQPIMDKLNIKGTLRVSFAIYNTKNDIDCFIKALQKAIVMLKE